MQAGVVAALHVPRALGIFAAALAHARGRGQVQAVHPAQVLVGDVVVVVGHRLAVEPHDVRGHEAGLVAGTDQQAVDGTPFQAGLPGGRVADIGDVVVLVPAPGHIGGQAFQQRNPEFDARAVAIPRAAADDTGMVEGLVGALVGADAAPVGTKLVLGMRGFQNRRHLYVAGRE